MTHLDDPRWQAARERLCADRSEGETPAAHQMRCITASYEMYFIEMAHTSGDDAVLEWVVDVLEQLRESQPEGEQ